MSIALNDTMLYSDESKIAVVRRADTSAVPWLHGCGQLCGHADGAMAGANCAHDDMQASGIYGADQFRRLKAIWKEPIESYSRLGSAAMASAIWRDDGQSDAQSRCNTWLDLSHEHGGLGYQSQDQSYTLRCLLYDFAHV